MGLWGLIWNILQYKVRKGYKKYMMPLLLAYVRFGAPVAWCKSDNMNILQKLKFFTLIPVLVGKIMMFGVKNMFLQMFKMVQTVCGTIIMITKSLEKAMKSKKRRRIRPPRRQFRKKIRRKIFSNIKYWELD